MRRYIVQVGGADPDRFRIGDEVGLRVRPASTPRWSGSSYGRPDGEQTFDELREVEPGPACRWWEITIRLSQHRDVRYADGSGHPGESRLPMPWCEEQDRDLLAFYRDLVAMRRRRSPAWRRPRRTLAADDRTGPYAYACGDGPDEASVVLNNGPEPASFREPAGGSHRLLLATEADVELVDEVLSLPAYGGAVLVPAAPGVA